MKKFSIRKTNTGFVFHLVAANGEAVGTSEVYTSLSACKHGIESVRTNAGVHVEDQTVKEYEKLACPKYEVYTDKGGHPRFRLIAHNGQEILASQAYKAKESCIKGIESVKANAPIAEVEIEE